MLTFHPLELRQRTAIAEDAVCLELQPPAELVDAYRFEAGQHLAVRALLGGRELRRTYSIASAAGGPLRLGIRVQGEMSRHLAEGVAIGERIEALEPAGRFRPALEPGRAKSYVAIAGGSGITPILSIVGTLLAAEPASRVLLIYGNRSSARTMFVDEVLALKNRHLERLIVQFVMSREPQDVELFNGRIDAARLRALARSEFDPRTVDEFFLCGPGSMVGDLRAALLELGAAGKVHSEHFGVDYGVAAEAPGAVPGGDVATVTVVMDGRRRSIQVPRDRTILDAARDSGLQLPYSCRAGVCASCRVKVVSGTVAMQRNKALEDWEVEGGHVLSCQARPTSDAVEITYDEN
ncbi:MAG: 2Fe-2S iron-sulfur cluster binding domain-containing protein [Gammaproteobacteria bacterium]|nr:2Fe-2S iron-sulfur cluster binding domain-containing protein [Gammaproteobacteria bacterium]